MFFLSCKYDVKRATTAFYKSDTIDLYIQVYRNSNKNILTRPVAIIQSTVAKFYFSFYQATRPRTNKSWAFILASLHSSIFPYNF